MFYTTHGSVKWTPFSFTITTLVKSFDIKRVVSYHHRFNLSDGILIKDNHIRAAGSIAAAVKGVRKKHGDRALVEVEVTNLKETREALAQSVDVIMLDNMPPARVAKALAVIDGRALVEVSGGITLDTVREYAETGVDFISVGSLTHSAPAVDISMVVA